MNHTITRKRLFLTKDASFLKRAIIILMGVALLTAASQLSIPLKPVPLTFQSITVVLIGMLFGSRGGFYTVIAYLGAGMIGLPVFANFSAGFHLGETSGYLIGFLPAVVISGFLTEKSKSLSMIKTFLIALLSVSIIFLCGLTVLSQFIGFEKAIAFGLTPFIFSETIKIISLSFIAPICFKTNKQTWK